MYKKTTIIFYLLITFTNQRQYIIKSASDTKIEKLAMTNDIKISIDWKLNEIKLNFCNEKSTKFLNDNINVIFVERIVSTNFGCFENWEDQAEDFLDEFFYGFLNYSNFAFSKISFLVNNEGGFLVLKAI